MNISWGIKVTALYSGFAIFLFTMLFMARNRKSDLVTENYYQVEINYQQRIDQQHNSRSLAEPVVIGYKAASKSIVADMPDLGAPISGTALIYRPSDASLDLTVDVNLQPGNDFVYNAADLQTGLWRMELTWNSNGVDYYNEEVIIIQ